jgi:hypothetical protein
MPIFGKASDGSMQWTFYPADENTKNAAYLFAGNMDKIRHKQHFSQGLRRTGRRAGDG